MLVKRGSMLMPESERIYNPFDFQPRFRTRLLLVPVGKVESLHLEVIPEICLSEFRIPASQDVMRRYKHHPGIPPPEEAFDENRQQYRASILLNILEKERKESFDYYRCIGLTSLDLFDNGKPFIWGAGLKGGGSGIVSLSRLWTPDLQREDEILLRRIQKAALYALGQTFGLPPCSFPPCIMYEAVSVEELDQQTFALCPVCRLRYEIALENAPAEHLPISFF